MTRKEQDSDRTARQPRPLARRTRRGRQVERRRREMEHLEEIAENTAEEPNTWDYVFAYLSVRPYRTYLCLYAVLVVLAAPYLFDLPAVWDALFHAFRILFTMLATAFQLRNGVNPDGE